MDVLKREKAYQRLRDAITFGELKPGEKVGEEATSDKFDLGRTPLREALRQLEMEGYVEVVPHKGAVVRKISAGELQNVYELLAVLEAYAVESATGSLTPPAIKQVEKIDKELIRMARLRDYSRWLEKNGLFHRFFLETSANPLLTTEIDNLRMRTYRFRGLGLSIPGLFEENLADHRKILDAVVQGKAEKAGKAMRRHVQRAGSALVNFLRENPWA